MMASGICGTDVMEWYRIKKAPRILGHEITGEIVESLSDKYQVGQRVFVSHHVPCNQCKYCLEGNQTACETLHGGNYDPGGFSQFIRVPALNVELGTYLLPENISYSEGTMLEPLACVVRGQRVIGVKKGQTVLILGSGFAGLLNIQMAKILGAKVIATDVNDFKLAKAREFGADEVLNARKEITCKADKVIVCTGAQSAIEQAFNSVDKKGVILLFAIPEKKVEFPLEKIWRDEITVTSSYGAGPVDLEEALMIIKEGKIKVGSLITHQLPLSEIQKGFDCILAGKDAIKVILEPQNGG